MDDMKRHECHLAWRNQTASRIILTHNQLLQRVKALHPKQFANTPHFDSGVCFYLLVQAELLISAKPKI
jgi:hypothetical protein